ncbi:MAG: cyclodeaminase/cyclohydrolase family protein [Streptosporangiales bacterium]|nr:cyclodeaminase/cyclohydrolase family protein [Streptosporangiales bacterium]
MRDQTVAEFLSELAARTSVPAGGASAALSAAQAAALIAMVARYSDGPRHDRVVVGRVRAAADGLVDEAVALAEADAAAFGEVAAAYRLPKSTEEERRIRSEEIARGLVAASGPPADLMSATARLADLAEEMLAAANRTVISDLAAAATAITSAAATARINIEANLARAKDDPLYAELMATAALAPEITDRAARLVDAVREELGA